LKLQITIDGKSYAVDVEVLEDDESFETPKYPPSHAGPLPAASHPQSHGGSWDAEGKVCRSPLMGLVIKVHVEPQQAVAAGQLLMLLEAMKMETNITAPRAGAVKSVHVKAGDSIKVNQMLIEVE
jgi:methylmalonyl-CoA carboxyltransferase small subunit